MCHFRLMDNAVGGSPPTAATNPFPVLRHTVALSMQFRPNRFGRTAAGAACGGAVKGAAGGALAGVAIGAIAGDAGKGAAIGATSLGLTGGVRSRRAAKAAGGSSDAAVVAYQQQFALWTRNFMAAMEANGYTVR